MRHWEPSKRSTASTSSSVASRRATVDFGSRTRSEIAVTPAGLCATSSRMANARSSDCTIDTDLLEFHCTAQFRIVEHAPMADDTLDLKTLTDDELVAQMHDDLYDGLADEIVEGTEILLERGWGADKVLNDALVEGMRIVGIDFRDGILFVPEVLLAANAMKAGMAILRPLLAETGAERVGTVVIGTVKGDIHDIGKNLVAMMLEGAGFEVYDLGINNPVENYLAALEEHEPDILGMSALLTTTMPYMKVVIDTLKEKGIRDDYIVLVGGAPLNEDFGKAVGADAYCRDAAVAAETAQALVMARRAATTA